METETVAVILAAGLGTRMRSVRPKALHPLAGKPLLEHVLALAASLDPARVYIVLGHGRVEVEARVGTRAITVTQEAQLGTGHALRQAMPLIGDGADVIVLSADQPLIRPESLRALLVERRRGAAAAFLTAVVAAPAGYGRVLRDAAGEFSGVAEEKDATPAQRAIREINAGTYCFAAAPLREALAALEPRNAQGEYYLPDALGAMRAAGRRVATAAAEAEEALGVNDRRQLAQAEDILYARARDRWLDAGVTLCAPETIRIGPDVELAPDVTILPFSMLGGRTRVEAGATVGPYTVLEDCVCGAGAAVEQSTARQAVIGADCVVGPYAYLRPGTVLAGGVKVGDFVEVKNSRIGEGSKVPHLSYIGDAEVGAGVNIGAGAITCNFDGRSKHRTAIEDGAFVGSNVNFVAPVRVGRSAVVGAGSTITADVPPGALGLERSEQRVVPDWPGAARTDANSR
ncbi:MAG: bifunctional UDP-N-acetylglucosamine diphosphorylase/glucosamine-1-phosphate N-acetyltransferase GlmU [Gracilibacteraceae bacterium]|jgi:bifunctional UDP-N-acetylglucosamine pyrophosphorylase/glucosamine-1-phosphate N-acetyltransferase|nr:bifunctional UDP-N-acetylglucosamine diphosphorylase/glucosamine-1-phosphate N-acetyltransferase GlmU [Gracilibacteraceae bacterium]